MFILLFCEIYHVFSLEKRNSNRPSTSSTGGVSCMSLTVAVCVIVTLCTDSLS